MMKRKILIVTNPGKKTDINYCAGVYRDAENYINFFKEPFGGYWSDSEIKYMDKPSLKSLDYEFQKACRAEFSIIIFSGHGWYSSQSLSNILQINDDQQIDSNALKAHTKKRIVILDCCREVYNEYILENKEQLFSKGLEGVPLLNAQKCKKLYNKAIDESPMQLIVSNAAGINQTAGDDSAIGGVYSSNLISFTRKWSNQRAKEIDLRSQFALAPFPACHHACESNVILSSGGTQNPQIQKPKFSNPNSYLPFAIVG